MRLSFCVTFATCEKMYRGVGVKPLCVFFRCFSYISSWVHQLGRRGQWARRAARKEFINLWAPAAATAWSNTCAALNSTNINCCSPGCRPEPHFRSTRGETRRKSPEFGKKSAQCQFPFPSFDSRHPVWSLVGDNFWSIKFLSKSNFWFLFFHSASFYF